MRKGIRRGRPQKKTAPRRREGAGRPSLHPGKDRTKQAIAYLTPDGWRKLAEVQEELSHRRRAEVKQVTVSDALEEGVHQLHRWLDLTYR